MTALSSPVTRSTAPQITSSLMAWPAKPVERSPLSPSSSLGGLPDSPISNIYSPGPSSSKAGQFTGNGYDPKGKGKAIEMEDKTEVRRYGPPKRPLTPNQLGRIAQSFGIIIPSLPIPSPSSSSRQVTNTSSRSGPHLLTVIPPMNLLNHALVDDDKRRKWKRGRLIPLQPSIGSMLLSIAREFGLPSTKGLALYLVNNPSSSSSAGSSASSDECSGPLISPSTWSTLFAAHLQPSSSSQSSSPSHTPFRPHAPFTKDMPFPPSPLSLVERVSNRERLHSFNSTSDKLDSSHRYTSSVMPPTPNSATTSIPSAIVGTIEFEVDPDVANWLEDWRRSGKAHRRKMSDSGLPPPGGKRELHLVKKVEGDKARTERIDFALETASAGSHTSLPPGDETLVTDSELDEENYKLGYADGERRLVVHEYPGTISVSPSYDQFTESSETPEIDASMLVPGEDIRLEDLLASPIELEKVQLERVRTADGTKRGSGVVMAEELDDLEKIMRSLSPKEIRLTSPRALTPRMAAKVAAARVQAIGLSAPTQTRQLPTSPLAGGQPSAQTLPKPPPLPARRPSPSTAETNPVETEEPLSRPVWPAVPFRSPSSPKVEDIFKSQPTASISAETLKRSQVSPKRDEPGEWRPPRPPRPKSPDLSHFGHARTLSHTMSPDLVEQLRSPPGQPSSSNASPMSPQGKGKPRLRGRVSSVKSKGIKRRISGKSLNLKWTSDKDKTADVPISPPIKETVGLFHGATDGPRTSSFVSLRDSLPSTAEFGKLESSDKLKEAPFIEGSGKQKLSSRFFSFGRKGSSKEPPQSQRSVSTPIKRSIISPPISSSLTKNSIDYTDKPRASESSFTPDNEPGSVTPPVDPNVSPNSPQSPTSLRSVKRKPVPGIDIGGGLRPSDSLASMRSFVLQDPPKKRQESGAV